MVTQNWNMDHFGYPPIATPLCAAPFFIGIQKSIGLRYFSIIPINHIFNFGASDRRVFQLFGRPGDMSYYFFYEENVGRIISSYANLRKNGTPPIWSLGSQQCGSSYEPDKEVNAYAEFFREGNSCG